MQMQQTKYAAAVIGLDEAHAKLVAPLSLCGFAPHQK
jgi:hypothetical protein